MKKIGVISCKMGCGAALSLGEAHLAFYLYLAQALLGEKVSPAQSPPLTPIVVQNETLNARPEDFLAQVFEQIGTLGRESDVVVLDLEIPEMADIRGTALTNVFRTIRAAVNWMLDEDPTDQKIRASTMVVLVPEIPAIGSVSRQLVNEHLQNGRMILVGEDGKLEPNEPNYPDFSRQEFCLKLREIRGKPIDLLRTKLIQQRGHFRREKRDGGTECVRIYFDGRLCSLEIRELVKEHIFSQGKESASHHLLYHFSFWNWLEGPLQRLATDLRLQCHPVEAVLENPRLGADFSVSPPLLIVPLIDTCHTLSATYDRICSQFSLSEFPCLSILSTSGDKEQYGIRPFRKNVGVPYFLRVSQERHPDPCPMCKLGLPLSSEGKERTLMLSSYDFWSMVELAGLKIESDPPAGRAKMPAVPDFPKMIELNGAWLSTKIGELLSLRTEKRLNDIVVVCPDQHGSKVLTEFLRVVCGVTVIRVDDEDIKKIREAGEIDPIVNAWARESPKWYKELVTSATGEVVLMDEFSLSGGTRRALHRLLARLGKEVICYFSLADFGPHLDAGSRIPALALYGWRVHQVTGNADYART